MGKGQSGVKSWMGICPYCGKRYRYTNFMVRYVDRVGNIVSFYERYMHPEWPHFRTDTHQLACKRKQDK